MKHSIKSYKIALVLDDSLDRPDGVQQYVRTLGGWLAEQGHDVHYLVGQSQPNGNVVHSMSRNVQVRFNKNRLSIPLPASSQKIRRLLAAEKYDVLHVQMPYNPVLAGKIIRAAHPTTAVVGTFHILPFGQLQQAASKTLAVVQKGSLSRFDAICSVSAAAQAFAKKSFGIESVVIPNMISMAKYVTAMKPHPWRIVFLGRLVARKGCHELLQAIAHLPEAERNQLEVLIAGDGPDRGKLEQFVAINQLHTVHFLGFIAEDTKPDLLASADIAVFPSLGGESFGIVLIEAMAAGAGVVVGGNNPGYTSVLGAWPETLVNPTNARQFTKKLQDLLKDDTLKKRIHQAQQQAVKQYDVAVAGQKILNMYAAALQSRRDVP